MQKVLCFLFVLCLSLQHIRFLANLEKAPEPLQEARPGSASWHLLAPLPPSRLEHWALLQCQDPALHFIAHSTTTDAPNGGITIGATASSTLPSFGLTVPRDSGRRTGKSTQTPSAGHRQWVQRATFVLQVFQGTMTNVLLDAIRFLNQNHIPKILFVHGYRDRERTPLTHVFFPLCSRWVPPSPGALCKHWFYILNQAEVHRSNACLFLHPKWILAFVYL